MVPANENESFLGRTSVERVSERELRIQRSFRAPALTVFRAMTEPELLQRWWAPKSLGVKLFECFSEPRLGGRYRFVFGHEGQAPMAFSGVYREFVPGQRLVYTQIFEPMPDAGEGVITLTFVEQGAVTRFDSLERYPSKEVLDGAIASGMERGMRETLEQLEVLLAELDN